MRKSESKRINCHQKIAAGGKFIIDTSVISSVRFRLHFNKSIFVLTRNTLFVHLKIKPSPQSV